MLLEIHTNDYGIPCTSQNTYERCKFLSCRIELHISDRMVTSDILWQIMALRDVMAQGPLATTANEVCCQKLHR